MPNLTQQIIKKLVDILLNDTEYTCEDRYAKWLDDKRKYPTIDVFVEENPKGKEIKQVTLLSL